MNAATRMSPETSPTSPAPRAGSEKSRHCPKCGSGRVHRSHRKGFVEHALRLVGAQVRRCHDCRLRQAWIGSAAIPLGRAEDASNFLVQVAIAGFAVLLCLAFVWWIIQRSAASAG